MVGNGREPQEKDLKKFTNYYLKTSILCNILQSDFKL
jgi:hypothetical protein